VATAVGPVLVAVVPAVEAAEAPVADTKAARLKVVAPAAAARTLKAVAAAVAAVVGAVVVCLPPLKSPLSCPWVVRPRRRRRPTRSPRPTLSRPWKSRAVSFRLNRPGSTHFSAKGPSHTPRQNQAAAVAPAPLCPSAAARRAAASAALDPSAPSQTL